MIEPVTVISLEITFQILQILPKAKKKIVMMAIKEILRKSKGLFLKTY